MIKEFFKELFIQLYLTLTTPDPCRRCIVRPCCSEECDQRIKYYRLYDGAPSAQRFCALAIIFGTIALIWGISKIIFK
jgi:sulfatase maturation enzyme AslB (radical SAM superfamily)